MLAFLLYRAITLLSATSEPAHIRIDPAEPARPGLVHTLADAIHAAADAPPGAPVDLELAPGVHELLAPVRIPQLNRPLHIHGPGGPGGAGGRARLIGGGLFHPTLGDVPPDDPVAARLPPESLKSIRIADLRPDWAARPAPTPPQRHGMNLPAAAGTEVFFNGRPLTPARWPNTGFAIVDGVADPGTSKDTAKPGDPPRPGVFRVSDRAHLERWAAAKDLWLSGYWHWDWADDHMPAGKIDPAAGTIALALPHTYGLSAGARYAVTNIPEELDAPGEYWLDVITRRVYLIPPTPPSAAEAPPELTLSLLGETMLLLDGASNIQITDLDFDSSRALAIKAVAASDIRIDRCTFRNLGTGAIELDGRRCTVNDSLFEDLGASGVSLTGGDRATLTHADNAVRDCTFRRCARTHRTYQPAIRLDGVGHTIANNLIEDLPHGAVIFAGNEHTIELNDIARVLLETGDSGAVYCGRDWTLHGTLIRHNLFHDIQGTDARYQNAVYLDDMASGITVEGNIFTHCHWGMLVGGGRDITIRNNIFDSCAKALSFDARGVGWMAKSIADPATSTLHQRLRAVPIDQEPWKTRYPSLQTYLTDRFGRPANGSVLDNELFSTPLGRIDDKECVKVDGNITRADPLSPDLSARLRDPQARRRMGEFLPSDAPPAFQPIPINQIGPRTAR